MAFKLALHFCCQHGIFGVKCLLLLFMTPLLSIMDLLTGQYVIAGVKYLNY